MMRGWPIVGVGACCGLIWWGISLALGARAYGALGTTPWAGLIAGLGTGVAMAWVSSVFYRRSSTGALFWYSPLSVYVAIGLYSLLVLAVRALLGDFHPDQVRWAVGVESMLGMWWGVTLLFPVPIVVHVLAYVNHRLLRRLVLRP
jgi:hypothetical protein